MQTLYPCPPFQRLQVGVKNCVKRAVILLLQNFFDRHLNSTDVKIQLVPKADLDVDSRKFTAD